MIKVDGQLGFVRLAHIFVVAAVVSTGCTNVSIKPYPGDWPDAGEMTSADCEALTGRYVNKALRRTGYVSTKEPAVTDISLSNLLDLLSESAIQRANDDSVVELHVQTGGTISYNVVGSGDALVPGGAWKCESGNVLRGRFSKAVSGESLPSGRRTIEIELRRLVGEQMAVHQSIEDCGAYFAVIPGCEQTDDWYLFWPAR